MKCETAVIQETKHIKMGVWIKEKKRGVVCCSRCGHELATDETETDICSNCYAKMVNEEELYNGN